jgi:hypothetical protein
MVLALHQAIPRWTTYGGVLVCCGMLSATAAGEDAALVAQLNKPLADIAERDCSAPIMFASFTKMTAPPTVVGEELSQATVWPKMEGWKEVSAWAKANAPLGEALVKAQSASLLGLPYGTKNSDPKWVQAGAVIEVSDLEGGPPVRFNYFRVVRTIGAYATAEMYRLGEEKDFDGAFNIGIAYARFLRQVCEQSMLQEKVFGLQNLSECMTVHRDFMWTFLDAIPSSVFQRVAMKEYVFLKPSDNERMRRLQLPEGDSVVVARVLEKVLGSGSIESERFADLMASQDAGGDDLSAFGSRELWRRVGEVHGSFDASKDRLANIYDDWWRRWKLRTNSPMQKVKTQLSATNPLKYRVVVDLLGDITEAFTWRNVTIAEINGTVVAAGICGAYRDSRNTWPKDAERAYATYMPKRSNFDPFAKIIEGVKRSYPLAYRPLTQRLAIDSQYGRVWATGCILLAVGKNAEDDSGATHSVDGSVGDLVLWPPVRALARKEGLVQ